jgi:hypothetical protein
MLTREAVASCDWGEGMLFIECAMYRLPSAYKVHEQQYAGAGLQMTSIDL